MSQQRKAAVAALLMLAVAVSQTAGRRISDAREARRNDAGALDSLRESRRSDDGVLDQARAANRGEGTYSGPTGNSPVLNAMAGQQTMQQNYDALTGGAQSGSVDDEITEGRDDFYQQMNSGKDELYSEIDQGVARASEWEEEFENSWSDELEDISDEANAAFEEASSWAD